MKIYPLLLACLAVSIPSARAQETPALTKALATIDPQARDLLARLDARYKKFRTFQGVVDVRGEEDGVPVFTTRLRLQLTDFNGVVTTAQPKMGTKKRVFDGQTVLETNSRFPRRFTRKKLDAERFSFRVFLRQSGVKGIAVGLLTDDNLASIFFEPDLQSLSMGASETVAGKTLQNVVFKLGGPNGKSTFTLLVDPQNLLLQRVTGVETSPNAADKTFVLTETYSEVKFDEALPPALFSTTPPPGFRVIDSFETNALTTMAPVNNDIKIKK